MSEDRLKRELAAAGHVFESDTDSEVVAHLIEAGLNAGLDPLAALKSALRFREAAYRVLLAIAAGTEPVESDLLEVNRLVKKAQVQLELVPVAGHYHLSWRKTGAGPEQILWRLARAMAELMTSDALLTVRVCAGEACGWLFLDKSRNHLRRWCSMSDCGNRAKAREFYKRARSA